MKLRLEITALLLGCLFLFPTLSFASEKEKLAELSTHAYWYKLGHYLPKPLGRIESTVDKPTFFYSKDGKVDPYSELVATYDAFYSDDPEKANAARCAYPARYTWLEQQFGRQAELNCPEMENWHSVLNPEGMTLVFPTAFMNNPSSMFGHTLLRVDTKNQNRNKELMAFAINFAAEPDSQDNPALFAIKGLFGQYPGRFTVMPYYRKVREYNDIESRDIWEYKLSLTEEEVNRILLHLWEMQRADFDYFFRDENCSYQLLALLELAREDLHLTDGFHLKAIPSDTVAKLAQQGLLKETRYRDSFGTRLLHLSEQMDDHLFAAAVQAKKGNMPQPEKYSVEQRIKILEFAYEWLNFELYDDALERDGTAAILTTLLYERSRLKMDSPFTEPPRPAASPEQGHPANRIGLAMNVGDKFGPRGSMEWRDSYHDLLDSQKGFVPGAQISFFDTQISIDDQNTTRLDRLYLLDVMALAPSTRTLDSLSWNIRSGFDRQPGKDKMAGRWFAQGGMGRSWGTPDTFHLYSLISAEVNGGELTGQEFTSGAGVEAGLIYQASDNHRVGIQGQYLKLFNSDAEQHADVSASWNWSLNRQWALRTKLTYQHWYQEELNTKLTAFMYF
ncbi:DUF4105 domain-containing protein [Veronia pacifica]|uniref:Uncharacterized protein n=1 Tax=Veronia pacifica TaxID=1080227 RepID=A0A1C3EK73_9GAMM|nr:DUF4105 domain-containing protein [Veronia pacifica]ODA33632.1 hypothetical protein A8L45_09635 [Veronia pacifica]